jgi:hypothetical protein
MTTAPGERPKQTRTITTSIEPPFWIGWPMEGDALELVEKLAFSDLQLARSRKAILINHLTFISFLGPA